MKRRKIYGWWRKQKIGKQKPYTGKYSFVRLKRSDEYSVQIKNRKGEWKTIDQFDSENDAVEFLVKVANNLDKFRQGVGDFD